MASTYTPQKLQDDIVSAYNSGETSPKQLGILFNISAHTARRILKLNNLYIQPKRKTLTKLEEQEILKEYIDNNYTITFLAEKYDISSSVVSRILANNNVESRWGLNETQKREVLEKFLEGNTLVITLAESYKVSRDCIMHLLNQSNINIPLGKTPNEVIREKEMIGKYTEGVSANAISKEYNIKVQTLHAMLRKNNIPNQQRKITDEEKKEMKRLYETGEHNGTTLSKIFNTTNGTVLQILKDQNVKMKDRGDSRRKYPVDHDFFDKLNTREKGYVFGLWDSDGYNKETKGVSVLSLKDTDREILEKVKDLFQPTKPLTLKAANRTIPGREKWADQWAIFVASKKFSQDLAKWGCVQNKTFKTEWPTFLEENEEVFRGYILGMIDGDGHLAKLNNFNIMATESFCEKYKDFIFRKFGLEVLINLTPKKESNNMRYAEIRNRENVLKVLNWLYEGATLFMKRKHDHYLRMLNYVNPLAPLVHEDGTPFTELEKSRRYGERAKLKRQALKLQLDQSQSTPSSLISEDPEPA